MTTTPSGTPSIPTAGAASEPRADASEPGLATIEEGIEEFRAGRPVIIVDNKDRENEGDVCVPAQACTADLINFMAMHARGLICVAMTGERLDHLKLPMMTRDNTAPLGTAFTVSVEAREGVTTGISAADRARTVQVLVDPAAGPDDLTHPGHMFPLRARAGGVLVRAGQTEASVDLAILAGLAPAAVICEIMRDDGTMARMPDLRVFAETHGVKIIAVDDLIAYRVRTERLVERVAESSLPTVFGEFRAIAYRTRIDAKQHLALVMGDIATAEPVLARVHDQCITGDVFGSLRCDCGEQLEVAMQRVADAGRGVILYMDQEGRGIGLHNKIRAYHLQDNGLDTVEANEALGLPADQREYGIGMQILLDLGVRRLRLMTNNPAKRSGLEGYGLEIVERIPIEVEPNPHNVRYLRTKREKMGHLLDSQGLDAQGLDAQGADAQARGLT